MFREAYRNRRCIVPIDGFFEWMAIKGAKVKQPYAVAMQDRSPCVAARGSRNCERESRGFLAPHSASRARSRVEPGQRKRGRGNTFDGELVDAVRERDDGDGRPTQFPSRFRRAVRLVGEGNEPRPYERRAGAMPIK